MKIPFNMGDKRTISILNIVIKIFVLYYICTLCAWVDISLYFLLDWALSISRVDGMRWWVQPITWVYMTFLPPLPPFDYQTIPSSPAILQSSSRAEYPVIYRKLWENFSRIGTKIISQTLFHWIPEENLALSDKLLITSILPVNCK